MKLVLGLAPLNLRSWSSARIGWSALLVRNEITTHVQEFMDLCVLCEERRKQVIDVRIGVVSTMILALHQSVSRSEELKERQSSRFTGPNSAHLLYNSTNRIKFLS